jgi:serine/threonine protein kinase
MEQRIRQRLEYCSDASASASNEAFRESSTTADIVSYLAVASTWKVDLIPYTWLPSLGHIGQGQSGTIQQSIADLQTSFAFKTFDRLEAEEAFEEAMSELRILGIPMIREHTNIVNLEGICWNVLPSGGVLPVLVFEKTGLGSLASFMKNSPDTISIETRIHLIVDILRAVDKLHSCGQFLRTRL